MVALGLQCPLRTRHSSPPAASDPESPVQRAAQVLTASACPDLTDGVGNRGGDEPSACPAPTPAKPLPKLSPLTRKGTRLAPEVML